jgi:hypothetical protein
MSALASMILLFKRPRNIKVNFGIVQQTQCEICKMSRPTELANLLGDASATELYTLVLRSPIVAAIAERTAKNMASPVTSIKVGSGSYFRPRSGIDPCIAVRCFSTSVVCVAVWLLGDVGTSLLLVCVVV